MVNVTVSPALLAGIEGMPSLTPSFSEVCRLNQLEMLNQLRKLPGVLFLFLALATLALIIYIYVLPRIRFKNPKLRNTLSLSFLNFSMGCMVWAFMYDFVLTYTLSEKALLWIEVGVVSLLALAVGLMLWKRYGKGLVWRRKKQAPEELSSPEKGVDASLVLTQTEDDSTMEPSKSDSMVSIASAPTMPKVASPVPDQSPTLPNGKSRHLVGFSFAGQEEEAEQAMVNPVEGIPLVDEPVVAVVKKCVRKRKHKKKRNEKKAQAEEELEGGAGEGMVD